MDENIKFANELKRDLTGIKVVLVVLVAALIFTSSLFVNQITQTSSKSSHYDPDCSNKTLSKTAECLSDFVIKNYKYVITDDEFELTTPQLLEKGGDCKDWTDFYERNFNKNGFYETERVVMRIRELKNGWEGHVFLVVSDESGYCTLDMTNVNCYGFDLD